MMDFDLSDEQKMLFDGAERFVRESYSLEKRRKLIASEEGFSRDQWAQFAELGWLALALPEDVGGLDLSFIEVAVLMTAFGRGPVLEPIVPTTILSAHLIDKAGDDAQRQAVLPAIAAGELMVAFAHDEANSVQLGPQPVLAKAEPTANGWSLTGRKTMVLGGSSADKFVVSAVVGAEKTPSLFLVDRNGPGVTVTSYPLIDGTRAADVALDNAQLDASARLSANSDIAGVIAQAIDRATLALLAEAVGCMEACLDVCSEYLKTRHQFGQPLGNFQSLQHIMADMFVDATEARSMLYYALAHIDGPAPERAKAISLAKVAIGEGGFSVGASAIQLHGGYGVTDEYVVSHYFRRLTSIKKYFGDVEDHLERVADALAG
jgi:alkylation response protein AidB-like acyl-CoA dehydrogenase